MNQFRRIVSILTRVLWIAGFLALGSQACTAFDQELRPRQRVLVIYQDNSTLLSSIQIAEGLERGLAATPQKKFEIYTEFLDSVRFASPDHLRRLADNLVAKFRPVAMDVVVAIGPRALRFALDHRSDFAPGAPLVFGDVSARTVQSLALPDDARGVISAFDMSKTLDLAVRLQPEATDIVVIAGSADFDRYWAQSARVVLKDRYANLPVRYLTEKTLDEFIAEVGKLPVQTIVLFLTVYEDAAGQKFAPREALSQVAAASRAPVYGLFGSYIGLGILGGQLSTFQSTGEDLAALVANLGPGTGTRPQIAHARSGPVIDWRQLVRWNLDGSRLPENAQRLNYSPTLWERYRWQMVLVGLVILAQSAAIAGLFIERRGRQIAEFQSRSRLLEVIHLNQAATAGALSASIAHELNQPLGAIRNNAEAAAVMLRGKVPDLKLIQQMLADIRSDNVRASEIILRLRKLLQKRREVEWQEFDLNDTIKGALSILDSEAHRRNVRVVARPLNSELRVRADQVHIQQVILNIAANAIDAMRESGKYRRELTFETSLPETSKVQVTISDTGDGIPDSERGNVFKPFYTTKPSGTGLGLSIARAIIETYDGEIWVDNSSEGGASFHFTLPLALRA